MSEPLPPDLLPDYILAELREVFEELYEAFEQGCLQTVEYFEQRQRSIDKALAAGLIRWEVREFLSSRHPGVSDLVVEHIPNVGLLLIFGRYEIRIFKSARGLPPGPGSSRTRRQFYSNNQLTLPIPELEVIAYGGLQRVSLVVLWEVFGSYLHKRLLVALPKDAQLGRAKVDVFWVQEIPHPATTQAVLPSAHDIDDSKIGEIALEQVSEIEIDTNVPSDEPLQDDGDLARDQSGDVESE